MKKVTTFTAFLVMMTAFATTAFAQDAKPAEPQETPQPGVNQQDGRAAFLRQLGLSQDQIRQIRRLNMERKPLMEAAQRNLREANRKLDEAIYADQVNENDVQTLLKEAQLAQAEVFKIRSMNEFAIRRILTAEQLVRFRDLRQRFEENVELRRKQNRQMQRPEKMPVNNAPFRDDVKPRTNVKPIKLRPN
jgi:Spy/CpxP family protein refolding chaperone